MKESCNLVTVEELIADGTLDLETGDEVGKLEYGTGDIPFIRTSDFGNWELKHDPKHRVSREVYEAYSAKQSAQARDILMVRDGTYLVGTTTILRESDLPILFSGGIYRIRVIRPGRLDPTLLFALLNARVVKEQIRNKRFTRDVIDTLGHRLREVVLPIPRDAAFSAELTKMWQALFEERATLRADGERLGKLLEEPTSH